jgi:hypothetical protein
MMVLSLISVHIFSNVFNFLSLVSTSSTFIGILFRAYSKSSKCFEGPFLAISTDLKGKYWLLI